VKTLALFVNHPECSTDCCNGMIHALEANYIIKMFTMNDDLERTLNTADIIAFPGGIGDASSFDTFFRRKKQNMIADFVSNGGHYLGICMGAYWAGSHYFDILDGIEPVQYIKQNNADIRRSYATIASVTWNGKQENLFFYDGCAIIGDSEKMNVVATYANGDPMAIIQNRIGLIGCHPESQQYWYESPRHYIHNYWHKDAHHKLLLNFVDQLTQQESL